MLNLAVDTKLVILQDQKGKKKTPLIFWKHPDDSKMLFFFIGILTSNPLSLSLNSTSLFQPRRENIGDSP
jgi:hypothetical protein